MEGVASGAQEDRSCLPASRLTVCHGGMLSQDGLPAVEGPAAWSSQDVLWGVGREAAPTQWRLGRMLRAWTCVFLHFRALSVFLETPAPPESLALR